MVTVNTENIRLKMFVGKMTGRDMAKILDISETSFYLKINGKRNFTAVELGTIAKNLKTEVNFFYN